MQRVKPFTQKLTGTGALISVNCGFRPSVVQLRNETQGVIAWHDENMAGASAHALDDTGVGTVDFEAKATGGISLTPQGFSIGTDADLNTASDVIYVIAW